MAYTTLIAVRRYLGLDDANCDNTLLQALITDSQSVVDAHCERTFEAAADGVRYFDAASDVDGRMLRIRDLDLAQITSITHGNGAYTLTASDYTTLPRNAPPYYGILLRRLYTQTWEYTADPEDAIAITGRWAYSVTAPRDVVRATERLAAYLYRQKDNAADLDRPVAVGGATLLPQQLPADVRKLLAPYVRRT